MGARAIQWGDGKREAFLDWIDNELNQTRGYRQGLEAKWRQWLELYRASATQPLKKYPFIGASNHMLPVIATDADQLYARFMQTVHAPESLWSIQALNESWVEVAKPMQDFLQLLDERIIKMYRVNQRALLEMVKLGTAIYKTHWHYESRPVVDYAKPKGASKIRLTRSVPVVDHVQLADFLLPPTATAINIDAQGGAAWVAERLRMSPNALRSMATASSPVLPNFGLEAVERILTFTESSQTEAAATIRRLDYEKRASNLTMSFDTSSEAPTSRQGGGGYVTTEVELLEIYARVYTTATTYDDIVVWYHQPTRTLLREMYQDTPFAGRPYDVVRYFPSDGFYGIGVCEQLEMFQRAESDMFNFQSDNVLLGNSIGIAAKAGSNIGPGEPIYPCMVKITDGDPRAEFMPFKLGDINPGIPQTFGMLQAMHQSRSGIGDLQTGQIQDLPSRTTGTTVLSLLHEGSRRPDLTIKDLKHEGLSAVGLKILQLLQYHIGQRDDSGAQAYLTFAVEALGMPEGAKVAEKLSMPLEDVELGLAVQLSATSGSANKDVERQNLTTLMQLGGAVAQQVIQLQTTALQFAGTGIDQTCLVAINALKLLFTRLLEQYDVRNIEDIVPAAPAQLPTPLPLALGAPAQGGGGPPGAGGGAPMAGPPVGMGAAV